MKIQVKIIDLKTVSELDFYWQNSDYKNLLREFGYPDAEGIKENEVLDFLFMAILDFKPADAAEILLTYKIGDKLNEGQIQNLANEMLLDKLAEEYPDPVLHFDIFNINQFLRKAYNGTFPDTKATIITAEIHGMDADDELTKEILIKSLSHGLRENNLIKRLYGDQLNGTLPFDDAGKVIWHFRKLSEDEVEIITSNYLIAREDFGLMEFETELQSFEED
ncbi:MAG: hypothetical protein ACTIJ9_04965 [Aequorivita sp.]